MPAVPGGTAAADDALASRPGRRGARHLLRPDYSDEEANAL
jgi:hypothetical protein